MNPVKVTSDYEESVPSGREGWWWCVCVLVCKGVLVGGKQVLVRGERAVVLFQDVTRVGNPDKTVQGTVMVSSTQGIGTPGPS